MAGEANIWNPRKLLQLSADTKRIEERITATAGQSLFTLIDFTYVLSTGSLEVHKNGLLLTKGVDWVENTISTFSLTVAATMGDQVVAVGYVAITGNVDVRDTDIFIANYQGLRDYVGTEVTLYAQGKVTKGDAGEQFYQLITGAAPGFYTDNNNDIIVPTGGDGSSAWVHNSSINDLSQSYTFKTVALMKSSLIIFPVGKKVFWQGYYVESDGGNNWGVVNSGAHTDDGGSIFSLADGKFIESNIKSSELSVLKFGAKAKGAAFDNMPAAIAALAVHDTIKFPPAFDGDFYGVGDGTLVVTKNKMIKIQGSSVIIRLSSMSSDENPVIWLEDEATALIGETGRSGVRSQSPTPEGVVLIGAETLSEFSKNMFQCRINSISVQGHVSGGATSGTPTHCIKINAPQYSNETACYFHRLTNIKVDNANYGISLNGFANANYLAQIFGQNLGSELDIGGALIWFNGAQETNIHGLFLHTSPNTAAIKSSTMTQPVAPFGVRVPGFNHCYGIIAEQGTGGRTLVIEDETSNNMFFVGKNSPLASTYPPNFFDAASNNTVFENGFNNSDGSSLNTLSVVDTITIQEDTFIEADIYQEKQGRGTVQEANTVDILTVRTGNRNGGILDISVFARGSLDRVTGIRKQFLVSEISGVQAVTEIAGGLANQTNPAVVLGSTLNGDGTVTFTITGSDNSGSTTYNFSWIARFQVENLINGLVKL